MSFRRSLAAELARQIFETWEWKPVVAVRRGKGEE
jgi:hypothetical protein